eukprot:m.60862 g.60862  ORF g.60862 m.60862 type:complete len:340 (+) comp15740_c0_seq37:2404-3423(+)
MRVIALEPELSADVESRPPKRLHRIWIQNAVLLFTHLVEKTDQRVEHVLAIHRKVPDFKLACGVSVVIQQLRCDLVVPTAAAVEVEEGGDTALPAHFTQLLRGLDVVQGPKVHLGSDGGCVYGAVVGVCWCSAVGVFADVAAEAVHDNLCIRGTLGRPAVTAACVLVTTQETVFSQGSDTRHEISLVGMHGKVLSKNLHRPDCVFHSQNRLLLLKIQHLSVRLASALDVLPVREFLLETLLDDLDLVRPDKQCFVAKHPQRPVGVVHLSTDTPMLLGLPPRTSVAYTQWKYPARVSGVCLYSVCGVRYGGIDRDMLLCYLEWDTHTVVPHAVLMCNSIR